MFRIVGRDAQGKRHELSVDAATEEEGRAIAREAGLVTVESVSIPPPLRPSLYPRLSGFSLGCLSLLGCVVSVALGALIGAYMVGSAEAPGLARLDGTIRGGVLGSLVGLVCGMGILVVAYRAYRERE